MAEHTAGFNGLGMSCLMQRYVRSRANRTMQVSDAPKHFDEKLESVVGVMGPINSLQHFVGDGKDVEARLFVKHAQQVQNPKELPDRR